MLNEETAQRVANKMQQIAHTHIWILSKDGDWDYSKVWENYGFHWS